MKKILKINWEFLCYTLFYNMKKSKERSDKMKRIDIKEAPAAIGAYSQAVKTNGLLFISGQIPVDPATGEFAGSDIQTQAEQVMKNLLAIVESEGLSMSQVVKSTILIDDIENFTAVDKIYASYFNDGEYPARAAYQVAKLPKNALVEIEMIVAYE